MVLSFSATAISKSTQTLALEVQHCRGLVSSSTTFLFDLANAATPAEGESQPSVVMLAPLSTVLYERCKRFVGFCSRRKSFVFVHCNSWLSSIDLTGLKAEQYTRHFFVPADYLSCDAGVCPVKTADDSIVFCLHGDIISLRNGLKFQEVRALT